MDEVNSDGLRKSGYVAHFMPVYNSRAVLGDHPAVPGQLQHCSIVWRGLLLMDLG